MREGTPVFLAEEKPLLNSPEDLTSAKVVDAATVVV